ncbi:predicted protein [Naegleria gruberi]|uniref:Predicted protein n=1 Tax=Naegleria gruberi TaxID=5762 RepID=D2VR29_NAEGR|nr:uncharacterized protein NAEGRDRAFT_51582 [Naegleria gruberi]EFC40818.1 predicted protein [Naegleria gruberi]|eukprot:XP_002673562.1 predicted protein [Naegleria gruberi strain NEG-M]
MEKVNEIMNKYPDATEVSLEHCGLKTLDEILVDLSKLRYLKVLRLANNQLRYLPSDMSGLQRVEYLDLRNNNFNSSQNVLSGLFSLPSLKHLYITLDEQEEDEIIVSLSNLESFNGTPLTDLPDADPPQYSPSKNNSSPKRTNNTDNRNNDDTNNIPPIEQEEASTPQSNGTTSEEIGVEDFKDAKRLHEAVCLYLGKKTPFVIDSIPNLKVLLDLKRETTPQGSINYQSELFNSKKQLFDISFEDVIEKVAQTDKKAASILTIVKNSYSDLCDFYYSLIKSVSGECFSKLLALQKELDSADKDIAQLLEETEALHKLASESEEAKNKIIRQQELERSRMAEEIGELKVEIERYKNRLNQIQVNRQKLALQVTNTPTQVLNQSTAKPKETKPTKLKPLSLKQLKEVIEEIYQSKQRFDQKCHDNQLPRETMEQHLYTYLNQKYGLKSLVFEWATAITFAVKRFSREDNDVKCFGKILRNEIDEEFRFVQKQLKDTTVELLKVFLRGKYSKKVDSELIQIIQNRVNGDLNEDEWVDIIKYMYNKEDSLTVIIRVNDAVMEGQKASLNQSGGSSQSNKSFEKSNKVPFKMFIDVLLDFQLESHEKFLNKFVKLFREIDINRDGILNQVEIKRLLMTVNPNCNESELMTSISTIDPNNNQQVTFSECVAFLSADLVKMASEMSNISSTKQSHLSSSNLSIGDL